MRPFFKILAQFRGPIAVLNSHPDDRSLRGRRISEPHRLGKPLFLEAERQGRRQNIDRITKLECRFKTDPAKTNGVKIAFV